MNPTAAGGRKREGDIYIEQRSMPNEVKVDDYCEMRREVIVKL